MNCKPGDLAYVTSKTTTPGLAGRYVITETLIPANTEWEVDGFTFFSNKPTWICRSATSERLPCQFKIGRQLIYRIRRPIADELLRPIRDPGDDAVDETLINNPVKETA